MCNHEFYYLDCLGARVCCECGCWLSSKDESIHDTKKTEEYSKIFETLGNLKE